MDALRAETISLESGDGVQIEAYLAQPLERPQVGGIVVIHHMPGYDDPTKEITRRFAADGFSAICPNLYHRQAPGASPEEAFEAIWRQRGLPDGQLVADVAGAAARLRALDSSNGTVAVVGFCSGGRQAVVSACLLDVDAAVDCYGAFVLDAPAAQVPLDIEPVGDRLSDLRCPLLGLFGAEDTAPSPDEVGRLDQTLTDLAKPHEFHTFPNAGHAFMATDRPTYRPEPATLAWELMREFLQHHIG
jgi:carboxymethylenebutenolidase